MSPIFRFQPFFTKAHFAVLPVSSTSSIQIRYQNTQQGLPQPPAKCPPMMANIGNIAVAPAIVPKQVGGTWGLSFGRPHVPGAKLLDISRYKYPNTHVSGINIPPRIRISISVPQLYRITPLENPTNSPGLDWWIEDSLTKPEVVDKGTPSQVEKQAARLIVIRRIKMNKHKLRKLRKRMKYVYAKVKLRREIRKEKAFLNAEMSKIREAQKFDAKAYVADILRRAKEEPLPTRWEGKYYPAPMIRQKIEIDEKRKRQEYLSILDKRRSEKQ